MLVLGIETSGRTGSIALVHDGEVLAEHQLDAAGRRHARTLVPEIRELLRSQRCSVHELETIAVSIGPGSFTGLRVGVVCAKTLAYALSRAKLVALDTFLAIAESLPASINHVCVIDDALRGDLYAGTYQRRAGVWETVAEPQLISAEKWICSLPGNCCVTGPGVDRLTPEIAGQLEHVAAAEFRLPQASRVALAGERACRAGNVADPWRLEPHYIRRSAAEEKADGAVS